MTGHAADPSLAPQTLRAAERALSRHFGGHVRITATSHVSGASDRSRVVRCHLEGTGAPATAIIKLAMTPAPSLWLPAGPGGPPGANARFANDHAGPAFLASLDLDPPLSPAFYGADREERLVLLEDLGDGENLAGVLVRPPPTAAPDFESADRIPPAPRAADFESAGRSPISAEAALEAYVRALGRIHAASAGHTDAYERLIESIQPGRRSLDDWRARVRWEIERLPETFAELDFEWTPGLVDDVQQVAASMLDPGSWLAYAHGDPCPGNDRIFRGRPSRSSLSPTIGGEGQGEGASAARIVFFDFEFGGLRHALLDGMYVRAPFPTCGFCAALPESLVGRLESAYRIELMKGIPGAGDDAVFYPAAVEACAFWLFASANRMLPHALRFDEKWGLSSFCQRVLRQLAVFSEFAGRHRHLGALALFASITHEKLRAKWPEVREMPLYPAFSAAATSSP